MHLPLPRTLLVAVLATASVSAAFALTDHHRGSRFESKAVAPAGAVLGTRATGVSDLASSDGLSAGWDAFAARHRDWTAWIDERTGLPTLARGAGIPWVPDPAGASAQDVLPALEARARAFLADNASLLGAWDGQLRLDTEASGPAGPHAWMLTFRQVVDGVPVDGARFDFHVVRGNLVAFGAERWASVAAGATPQVNAAEAWDALYRWLALDAADEIAVDAGAELLFVAADPRGATATAWSGARGAGLAHALAWRLRFHAPNEEARWIADVDARTGRLLSMVDDTKYDRAKGGVFPVSSDGIGPEGVERPNLPMPFADVSVNGVPSVPANAHGLYACTAGSSVTTKLAGPYVRISDACGAVNETTTCGADLDLGAGPGTDCAVPDGASPGNTHASRTCFFHVNRLKEMQRYWLPDNAWLNGQVQVNSNVNATCNASWGGSLNMYRSGNGCRNTCELMGVFCHELGHGLDQNDGGGYDNPTEAYADVVAIFDERASCVGRGFVDSNCDGYGDACLNCTGVRDEDWDQHASHAPATPQGFLTNNCGGGDGPCGREGHCEARVGSEALFDLATRDLPNKSGLDRDSAWQLAERLWYQSRKGSGGNAYNCSLPSSDGCGTTSWFHRLRVADDDDGNLANGTPHAAAIFAAFQRHHIACGAAADASNQNTGGCAALGKPDLAVTAGNDGVRLSWGAVPNAARYRVYRDELGCERAQVPVATLDATATEWLDAAIAQTIDISYRVQAIGANAACESPVSDCRTVNWVPFAGSARYVQPAYACAATATLEVQDGNAGTAPLVVQAWSDTERTPETVVLAPTAPGSSTWRGTVALSTAAAAHGDAALSVTSGDRLSIEYRDADDGSGHAAVSYGAAVVDCAAASPSSVQVTDLTDASAVVRWTTAEPTTGRVEWGATAALGNVAQDTTAGTSHAVTLAGLGECGRYFFRVVAIDRTGNESRLDAAGQPFAFNVAKIPGVFRDDFESTGGWTLEGEWQINAPQGKGSNNPDPGSAFSGTKVLGHDLTGLGTRPGDYEKGTTQRAFSPNINLNGKTGVEIKFRRWLNAYMGATASIEVRSSGGVWNQVWHSNSTFGQRQSSWSFETVDISQYADNRTNVQVAFKMVAGSNNTGASSWNVDRFIVRQAGDPPQVACGGCGGAPTFGGITGARDADPCSPAGGVVLAWDAAPAWGTGSAGTYAVYRDAVPDFTPSAANRLAAGVATTTYTDDTVADGQTWYYLVRAENDETCGGGPANGGVTDANTAYAAVKLTSSQPVPAAVSGVGVEPPAGDAVRLAWSPNGAPLYRVLRSASAVAASFVPLEDAASASFDDAGAARDGATWFYLVRAVNGCGAVGP